MPTIDPRAIAEVAKWLNTGFLVLIADVHNDDVARLAVKEILEKCIVKALFLELPSDSAATNSSLGVECANNYGLYLHDAARKMSRQGLSATQASKLLTNGGYFSTPDPTRDRGRVLVGGGREPDLATLTGIAIANKTQVIPIPLHTTQSCNAPISRNVLIV